LILYIMMLGSKDFDPSDTELPCMLPYVYLIGVFPFFIIIIFLIFSRKKAIIYIDIDSVSM
jgi:hypothetical protein